MKSVRCPSCRKNNVVRHDRDVTWVHCRGCNRPIQVNPTDHDPRPEPRMIDNPAQYE